MTLPLPLFGDDLLHQPARWSRGAFTIPGCDLTRRIVPPPRAALDDMLAHAPTWTRRILRGLSQLQLAAVGRWLALHRVTYPNCAIEIVADPESTAIIYLRARSPSHATAYVGTALCLTKDDIHRGEPSDDEYEDETK